MHFTAAPSSDRINACTAGYDAARIQREEFMMNMAVVSLIALAAAIVLGFVKKVNVGIVAIAMA